MTMPTKTQVEAALEALATDEHYPYATIYGDDYANSPARFLRAYIAALEAEAQTLRVLTEQGVQIIEYMNGTFSPTLTEEGKKWIASAKAALNSSG